MKIYCGIDFGTTNTVVSISDRNGELIDSFSIPTTMFIPYESQGISTVFIGRKALEYYEAGRPGRYIHSIKRSLSDPFLKHTRINRTIVKLEELISLFLNELKKIIWEKWCITPLNVVLGRPVKFSLNPDYNSLANERLLKSFRLSGFIGITQLEEPVAASLCFEDAFSMSDKSFLIIDLGGGTSDFSLVSRDAEKKGIEKYTVRSIDGINLGGDNFDEDIMFNSLSPLLGIHSTFESFDKRLPMPTHLYKDVCRWNSMHLFDMKKLSGEFSDYLYKASEPVAVHRLRAIIENNLSHKILEKVRTCKHKLSSSNIAELHFNELNLGIKKPITEDLISDTLRTPVDRIIETMERTINGSDRYHSVDRFVLTGGSSQVSYIKDRISVKSGNDKILMDDDFYNSVSKGLSLFAYYNKVSIV